MKNCEKLNKWRNKKHSIHNIFYNGEVMVSFLPRDKFMHFAYTKLSFSVSKEINEKYGFKMVL